MTTTTITSPPPSSHTTASPRRVVDVAIDRLTDVVTAPSITVLRISLGVVFLLVASLDFVLGASPAEDLASATVSELTFGIVTGTAALYLTAPIEIIIGITLVTGHFLKVGLVARAGALVGIMTPLIGAPCHRGLTHSEQASIPR
jgi:putative oxidoreductase